jgi:hypothetical protein
MPAGVPVETMRPLVVGYVFRKKKASTFRATLQADLAGVAWKAVDLDALESGGLADQGPFDVVLHKLSEDIHATFGLDDESMVEDLTTDDGDDELGTDAEATTAENAATVVAAMAALTMVDVSSSGSSGSSSGGPGVFAWNRAGTACGDNSYPGQLDNPLLAAKRRRAARRVRALEEFAAAFPAVPVVDHPAAVARVVSRACTCELLATVRGVSLLSEPRLSSSGKGGVSLGGAHGNGHGAGVPLISFRLAAPRFVVAPRGLTQGTAAEVETQLRFQGVCGPLLVKPEVACGPTGSHLLTVVLGSPTSLGHLLPRGDNHSSHSTPAAANGAKNGAKSGEGGVRTLSAGELCAADEEGDGHEGDGRPNGAALSLLARPSVVQEYVNHGAILLKAYVIGNEVRLFARPSLPDLPGGGHDGGNGNGGGHRSGGNGSGGSGGSCNGGNSNGSSDGNSGDGNSCGNGNGNDLGGVCPGRVVVFDSQKPYPSLEVLLAGPALNPTAMASAAATAAAWAVCPAAPRPSRDAFFPAHSGSHPGCLASSLPPSPAPPSPAPSPSPPPRLARSPSPRDEAAVPGGPYGDALRAAVQVAALKLKAVFGLTLFGFDCVVPVGTCELMVLDVNYFPSYKELKGELSLLLRKHFTELALAHQARAASAAATLPVASA